MSVRAQAAVEPLELVDGQRAARLRERWDSEPLPVIQRSIDAFRRYLPERRLYRSSSSTGGFFLTFSGVVYRYR